MPAQPSAAPPEPLVLELTPGQDPASIEAAIKAASASGRPVTIRWTAPGAGAPASAQPAHEPVAPAPGAARAASTDETDMVQAFQTGLRLSLDGIAAIPDAASRVLADFSAATAGRAGPVAGILLAATLAAALLAVLARRLIPSAHPAGPSAALRARAKTSSVSALAHLAGIGVFVVLASSAHRILVSSDGMAGDVAGALLRVAALSGLAFVAGDWLLSPRRPERRLLAIARPGWHFGFLLAYGITGALFGALAVLATRSGAGPGAERGLVFVGATVLTVVKLVWFGAGRRDLAGAFAGASPGLIRRAGAAVFPFALIALALLLWAVGCVSAALPQAVDWTDAARATQMLALLVPLAALGVHALSGSVLDHHEPAARPVVRAALVAGRVLLTGAVWLFGLFLVTRLWARALGGTEAGMLPLLLDEAGRIGFGVVAGWSLWSFVAAFFRVHVPNGAPTIPGLEDEDAPAVQATRLSTVLPLLRDVALGLVIAVTALLVLSSLGLDIAPLLAGFGVFGLALSFGSQALVRDIVSGVFFIADDAFRVGEYIDAGKLKGTVERISLRSVRLRHQNGQFHTLPFGQIQSITNFSRDWSVVKFELKFALDVDVETLRKTVKKVGLEMMEVPELAAQLLQPLKMQGIQDVTESALVVRLKFTARPGNPSLVQRDAIRRLLAAFRENGIEMASNAVLVRSGSPDAAAAASAAALRRAPPPADSDPQPD